MINYRLEGLTRRAEEIVQELKEDGLMGADIEIIGAVLFTKFQGQDDKMSEMLSNTAKLIEETTALLERLKNKTE